MKMKNIHFFSILILISLNSCKSIKLIQKQKVTFEYNLPNNFELLENKMILFNKDIKRNFQFDLGATNNIIYDKNILKHLIFDSTSIGETRTPFGKSVKNITYFVDSFSFSNFKLRNYGFSYIQGSLRKCDTLKIVGLIGAHQFYDNILFLDYKKNEFTILDRNGYNNLLKSNDFNSLNSVKFKSSVHLEIIKNIRNTSLKLLFDNGYSGDLIIEYANFLKIANSLKIDTFLKQFMTVNGIIKDTTYQCNLNFKLLENETEYFITIETTKKTKVNNLGLNFIKNYNWIINYYDKNVYVKKIRDYSISDKINNIFEQKENKIYVVSGLINAPKTRLNIGDEIIKINNTEISDMGYCDFFELYKTQIKAGKEITFSIIRNGELLKVSSSK